jgi:hypothetical protein
MADRLTDEQAAQIGDALARGEKITAIKLYREFTNKGLAESKEFIETLQAQLIQREPEKYAQFASSAKGCNPILLGIIGAILVAIAVIGLIFKK